MNTTAFNLFIVDDNALMVASLRNYLNNRFGNDINISTFNTGESALKNVDVNTNIVILDYFLGDENGNDVLKSIKVINPKTEVIMLSRNEDIGIAIDAFRKGATEYIIKDKSAWAKLTKAVYNIITLPIRILVEEFKVSKFVAIFLLTFITMGIVVALTLHYFDWNTLKK